MDSPNPNNDRIEVFPREDGKYDFRRVDCANGQIIYSSNQGYESEAYARTAAETYHPELPIINVVPDGGGIDGP